MNSTKFIIFSPAWATSPFPSTPARWPPRSRSLPLISTPRISSSPESFLLYDPLRFGRAFVCALDAVFAYRAILIAAIAVFAIFSLIAGMSQSLTTIFAAQIAAGIAAASSTPLGLMMIGDFFRKERARTPGRDLFRLQLFLPRSAG